MEHDLVLAQKLAEKVLAQNKECWRNSVLAFTELAPADRAETYYVEGILLILEGKLPIEHGWLEVRGKIVDVTNYAPQPYFSEPTFYHAVHRYRFDQIWDNLNGYETLPLYTHQRDRFNEMVAALYSFGQPL